MSDPTRTASSGRTHPIVLFKDVDVVVGGRTVLHQLSWALYPGEHWGVVGPNGSGKTSFLKLIAGALAPAGRGRRRYDFGYGIQTDAVEAQHHITLVGHELQDRYRRLGWNFSSLEVVLSGIFRTDVPRREPDSSELARARALLEELDVLEHAQRPFLELSRGLQRRVLIARSLGFEPKVLLLDEAAAGLDEQTRRLLDDTIERITRHTAIICTSHDVEALPRPINRVLQLSDGRIEEAGALTQRGRCRREAPPKAEQHRSAGTPRSDRAERPLPADELPLIEVEHADIWFDERRILHDIDWQHCAGEHWLVLGANGAGKSTFLRLLHGQIRPAKGGSIRWPQLGNPRNVWTLRRQVAWVSPELQSGYLYPTTVRNCVASGFDSSIGLMRKPTPGQAQRVETLLRRFELATLADRPVSALSYGQMRRVLIVRALVNEPRVLLLDEPWEGLDGATLDLLQAHLELIIAHGTHLVCASHVPREVAGFTHELEIDDGRVVRAAKRAQQRLMRGNDAGVLREN